MAVAQVNVGFQVKVKELEDQMKKANASFRATERSFKSVGAEFSKTGQLVSKVNPQIGQTIGKFGELGSMLPQVGKEIAKVNILARANPWITLATVIAAAGVAFAAFASKTSEAAKQQKLLSDATLEAEKNIVKERVELGLLVRAAKDETKSKEERLRAIKAINVISPEYLGNINLENINTDKTTEAIGRYTSALREKAKTQAVVSKMTELEAKRLEVISNGLLAESENFFDKAKDMIREYTSAPMPLAGKVAVMDDRAKRYQQELKDIDDQIKALEEYASAFDISSGIVERSEKKMSKKEIIKEGTIKAFEYQIKLLQEYQREIATTPEEYNKAADKILEVQKKIDAIIGKRDKVKPIEVVAVPEKGSMEYYDRIKKEIQELMNVAEIGSKRWVELSNQLTDIEVEIKAKFDEASFDEMAWRLQAYQKEADDLMKKREEEAEAEAEKMRMWGEIGIAAFDKMGEVIVSSMDEGESALGRFGKAMAQTVIQAISAALSHSLANAVVAGTETGKSMGPASAVVLPILVAGMMGAVFSAFAGIPKFADGGIVSGPTLGLMGEYAGAANNPEVIAPLSKLKDLIEPAGVGNMEISLGMGVKLTGSDLELVIERAIRKNLRTR